MSRFELYGGVECRTCKYFVRGCDDPCETPRCTRTDNTYRNWLGLMYKRRPDDINWDHKCKEYKPKGDGK